MTLPLDFPPLLAEAERLAQEHHDAGVDDESIVSRWDDLSPATRTRLVNAQARLLADPTRRDSQAWMAEWIETHGGTPHRKWASAAHLARVEAYLLLMKCCDEVATNTAAAVRLAQHLGSVENILVACCLALYEREGR